MLPEQVADALAGGQALVEIFKYAPLTQREAGTRPKKVDSRYTAIVVRHGEPPLRVDLGPVPPINRAWPLG